VKHQKTALLVGFLALASFSGGCREPGVPLPLAGKAQLELPMDIQKAMKAQDMAKDSPILLRIFKEENQLEVWKQRRDGIYGLIATYDICKWSGKLGPKYVEGDRQAPEGFYTVRPAQMNPYSKYYLAFDLGFPNAYDRANGRTGRHLMVHGACSSAGCYSMTDENIAQIYAFGRDSFKGGQREFHIHAFPFRMTSANMRRYEHDANFPFWTMLKQGYDLFEANKKPPKIDVCERRYVFNLTKAEEAALNAEGICPASTKPAQHLAYGNNKQDKKLLPALIKGLKPQGKAPAPSIQGMEEAKLVADWSRRRARGEKVATIPPSLSPEVATSADMSTPSKNLNAHAPIMEPERTIGIPAQKPSPPEGSTTPEAKSAQEGLIKQKKGWSLFGRKRT